MSRKHDGSELNGLVLKSRNDSADREARLLGIGSRSWFPLRLSVLRTAPHMQAMQSVTTEGHNT